VRIDCHLHTARYSACSRLDPERACKLALARGLDALVFTEHHRYWPREELARLGADHPGLTLLTGVELTLAEGYDLVLISGEARPRLAAYPPFSAVVDALAAVREHVFAFVAHPFRYDPELTRELAEIMAWADGLEAGSVNVLRAGYHVVGGRIRPDCKALTEQTAQSFGLVQVYNSDAHDEPAVGAIANDFPGETVRDEDALVRLLKRAQPGEHQEPALLARLLG